MFSLADKKTFFEKFCDISERGENIYLKLNCDKLMDELTARLDKVLEATKKHGLRSDQQEG